MEIARPLRTGILLRRYKRFLADIDCGKDGVLTVHCPNSGSMKGCAIPGATAWISDSENPKRKLRYTLEIIETDDFKICVNTQRPNGLVEEAIRSGVISELDGYEEIKREVRYGSEIPASISFSLESRRDVLWRSRMQLLAMKQA